MIKLEVSDYCQKCGEFEPDVKRLAAVDGYTTLVLCEHNARCAEIYKKAKEDLKQAAEEE